MKVLLPLVLPSLLLMTGCAALSGHMEACRQFCHGQKAHVYKRESGSYGVMGITSLRVGGHETRRTSSVVSGPKAVKRQG